MGPLLLFAMGVMLLGFHILRRVLELRRIDEFKRRFPPLSDDDFVARCGPNTNRQIALRVRQIVADQLGVEYARIYPESFFVDDLGAD